MSGMRHTYPMIGVDGTGYMRRKRTGNESTPSRAVTEAKHRYPRSIDDELAQASQRA